MTVLSDNPKLEPGTLLVLGTGRIVKMTDICYSVGRTPDGIAYRVLYKDDTAPAGQRGCRAEVRAGAWREVTESLAGGLANLYPKLDV
jgi:hypothetical protein